MAEMNPFEHRVVPRHTDFQMPPDLTEVTIQDVYGALSKDALRNAMIADDIVRAIESGRSPLLLTGRTSIYSISQPDSVAPPNTFLF